MRVCDDNRLKRWEKDLQRSRGSVNSQEEEKEHTDSARERFRFELSGERGKGDNLGRRVGR